jgi:uncharacterized protein (TIGR03067 family)
MATLLAAGLFWAVAARAQDDKKELDKLKGNWTVESAERDGQPNENIKGDTLMLGADGKFTVKAKNRDETGTYKIGADKKLKTIDITPEQGAEGAVLGIYMLDGDNLTICFARGKERPTEFTAGAGSERMLIKLKRAK